MFYLICFLCGVALVLFIAPIRAFFLWLVTIPFYRDKCPNMGNYGVFGYVGDFGSGKTYAMTKRIAQLEKEYKGDCYIFTNYGYSTQTAEFNPQDGWEFLCGDFDKPVIIAVDEIQNYLNSRDWQKTSSSLMECVSQCRKGKGKTILYTTPCASFADSQVRNMSAGVYKMTCLGGRVVTQTRLTRFDIRKMENGESPYKLGLSNVYLERRAIREKYNSFGYADKVK